MAATVSNQLHSSALFDMTAINLDSKVTGKLTDIVGSVLQQELQKRLTDHLLERQQYLKSADIQLEILDSYSVPLQAKASVAVRLTGSINDSTIDLKARASRGLGTKNGAAFAMAAANMAVAASSANKQANAFGTNSSGLTLDQCVDECIATLAIDLDRLLKVPETRESRNWRMINFERWGVVAALILVQSLIFISISKNTFGLLAASLAFASLSSFAAVTLCGLVSMPSHFFFETPRGKKAMARSGVKSVLALRILCLTMIPILVAFTAGSLAFAYVNTKVPENPNIIKPGQPVPPAVLRPQKQR